jgi:hypothetical protein
MTITPETVGVKDLEQFLADNGLVRNPGGESVRIWNVLVLYGSTWRPHGLPLAIYCAVCGQPYGTCRDNYRQFDERVGHVYRKRQLKNWRISVASLASDTVRANVETGDLRNIGELRRACLTAWLDHLEP